MSVNQDHLIPFGIPPSRANAQIMLPLSSAEQVSGDMQRLGLTAGDLKPLDWRKKYNLDYVKNQETCGDCWAQSSTASLTDRFIIHKGIENLNLNPVIPTQCVNIPGRGPNTGCGGGSPQIAGEFFEQKGVIPTSEKCPTFKQEYDGKKLPSCQEISNTCFTSDAVVYKANKNSTRSLAVTKNGKIDESQTITNMKKELLNGPYPVCYFVPKDFAMNNGQTPFKWQKTNGIFINGAYNDELDKMNLNPELLKRLGNPKGKQWADIMMEGPTPAAHAVELVGWDVGDAGPGYGRVPYWIIKNSWGDKWNENGYFRIAMNIAPTHYNKNLGLDVPATEVVIGSTNTRSPLGGMFGGGTAFDPDLNTGAGKNHKYPPGPHGPTGKKSSKISTLEIIAIIVAILILVGIGVFFFRNSKEKRHRKRK